MSNKKRNIIIISLICAIVALGAILAVYLVRNSSNSKGGIEISASESEDSSVSNSALDELLSQQPMFVNGINYYYQTSSEQLLHDAMGASVYNNSEVSIKSFVIAFCAFDANGEPIKILQPEEEGEGGYIRTINYEFSKAQGEKEFLAPGETCKDILMYVKAEPQIVTVKACVKSYISSEDISWSNPYYKTFLDNYSGKAQVPEAPQTSEENSTQPDQTTAMPSSEATQETSISSATEAEQKKPDKKPSHKTR